MQKITRPYEILVRLKPNGVEAAHVAEVEEIVDGGTVLMSRQLLPRPLALAGEEFGSVMAHLNATVLAERDACVAENADLKGQIGLLLETKARQEAEIERLRVELAGYIQLRPAGAS